MRTSTAATAPARTPPRSGHLSWLRGCPGTGCCPHAAAWNCPRSAPISARDRRTPSNTAANTGEAGVCSPGLPAPLNARSLTTADRRSRQYWGRTDVSEGLEETSALYWVCSSNLFSGDPFPPHLSPSSRVSSSKPRAQGPCSSVLTRTTQEDFWEGLCVHSQEGPHLRVFPPRKEPQ